MCHCGGHAVCLHLRLLSCFRKVAHCDCSTSISPSVKSVLQEKLLSCSPSPQDVEQSLHEEATHLQISKKYRHLFLKKSDLNIRETKQF